MMRCKYRAATVESFYIISHSIIIRFFAILIWMGVAKKATARKTTGKATTKRMRSSYSDSNIPNVTFKKVWAGLNELREAQKETIELFKATDKRFKDMRGYFDDEWGEFC